MTNIKIDMYNMSEFYNVLSIFQKRVGSDGRSSEDSPRDAEFPGFDRVLHVAGGDDAVGSRHDTRHKCDMHTEECVVQVN